MFSEDKIYTFKEAYTRMEAARSMGKLENNQHVNIGRFVLRYDGFVNPLYTLREGGTFLVNLIPDVSRVRSNLGNYKSPVLKVLDGFVEEIFNKGPEEFDKLLTSLGLLWGLSVKYNEEEDFFYDKEAKRYDSVKHLGKTFKLNKLHCWPIMAEKLKSFLVADIRFVNTYEELRSFYVDKDCSGGSCMRYSFDSLPFHPCIVYAQDAKDVVKDNSNIDLSSCSFNVSNDMKLAVMFDEQGTPRARCMVNGTSRGKAQGSRASELVKWLSNKGYDDDDSLEGCVNIIRMTNDKYIMPYIDGHEVVDTDGKIGEGEIPCSNTCGYSSIGVWSDWHQEYLAEDEAVWSDVMEDHIQTDYAVSLYEGGYAHPEWDDVHYSEHSGEYFCDTDDWYYVEFKDDWIRCDEVEDIAIKHIEDNASISDLIEFANSL